MVLLEILEKIEDPRSYHGKEYKLHHILLFTIFALLAGAKTYNDVHLFIKQHFISLKEKFKLKWRRYPESEVIRRILIRLDPDDVERVFREYGAMMTEMESGQRHICFDGKALGGSFSHAKNQRAARVFNAFSTLKQVVIAHIPLGSDKDHEIPAFQQFLLDMNLKGVVITADALHCQKKL